MAAKNTGATVKDCEAAVFIAALAEHFKKAGKMELPEWHDLVKTASFKEMCPMDPDWYFIRAASIARKIYLRGGSGVGALSKVYGGSNNKGVMPAHFARASRGCIRHILKQLEQNQLVAKQGDKKGRFITKDGQRELDTIAGQVVAASKSS